MIGRLRGLSVVGFGSSEGCGACGVLVYFFEKILPNGIFGIDQAKLRVTAQPSATCPYIRGFSPHTPHAFFPDSPKCACD